jgi:hypothetical protein
MLRYRPQMTIDREGQQVTTNEPGLPPSERGDNPESPAEGGSSQGVADEESSSGGSRGPGSGGDAAA